MSEASIIYELFKVGITDMVQDSNGEIIVVFKVDGRKLYTNDFCSGWEKLKVYDYYTHEQANITIWSC